MILHIINKSQSSYNAFKECITHLSDQDRVILIEDGVYNAMPACYQSWQGSFPEGVQWYVLKEDAGARGISNHVDEQIVPIDYHGFVELVTTTHSSISWF